MAVIMRAVGISAVAWFLMTIWLAFTNNDYVWGGWLLVSTLLFCSLAAALYELTTNKDPWIFLEE